MRRKNRLQVLCQSAEGEPLPLLVQSDGKPGQIRYLRDSPFGYGGFFRNTLPRWVVNAAFQQEAARRSSRMRGELEEIHPGWAHPSEAEAVDFDFFLRFFLPAIESHVGKPPGERLRSKLAGRPDVPGYRGAKPEFA
jgi:hypothetical protein